MNRLVLAALAALWLTAAAALVCLWLRASTGMAVVAVGLAAIGGTSLVAWAGAEHAARLRNVRRLAERALAATPAKPRGGESQDQPVLRGDELARLRKAVAGVTERNAGQVRELAKKSRNLAALIDGLDEPLIVTDSEDLVLLCNRAAELLTGSTPGQLVGKAVGALFTNAELLRLHGAARAGQTHRARCTLTTPIGPRVFGASAAPLPAAWGEGVFGVVLVLRDVTDLAHAVQMSMDFVANASHELRTPLAAVRMSVETLRDGAADDPPMRARLLQVAGDHVERLESLLRDLMDLSRLDSSELRVHPESVALSGVRHDLESDFAPALKDRKLTLEFQLDERLEGMRTDPRLLSMIIRNLVDNATKYAFEGSTIRVTAHTADGAEGPVARWAVADRGVGIPLAQQDRVFERFYQVDAARTGVTARRGTGLGLALVKSAAEALGGRVGLESVWGQGTTVWAEIPWLRAEEA
ncbi:MAG: ATP-binding protein [Phycisphaerales bacterium]